MLVKGRSLYLLKGHRIPLSIQDLSDVIICLVFIVEFQIICEVLCYRPVLDILEDHFPVRRLAQHLIDLDQPREVFPASGSGKTLPVHCIFNAAEILPARIQIRDHRLMDSLTVGIFFPHGEIRLYIDLLQTVQRNNIKLTHRFIVLRRIARRYDDPAVRQFMSAERLSLKKLEHSRRQRLRDAVDLVEEQNPLTVSGLFHLVIDRRYDLTHRIFGHRICPASVLLFPDKRQSHRALSRVVGDRVRYQSDPHLFRYLLHNLRLSDPRRSHKKDRSLPDRGNLILPEGVL